MKKILLLFVIFGLIYSCGSVKTDSKQLATIKISKNIYSDPNPPQIEIAFPFNISSFTKPQIKKTVDSQISMQTLLTDDLSKTVNINKITLSNKTFAQTDIQASTINKPIFIEKKENGYCVLFFNQDIKSNNLEGRVLNYDGNKTILTIRVIEKLYSDKPSKTLINKYIKYTRNICKQVFK